ncbi:MAG: hypothetical protein ACOCSK_03260 [Rhodothermales bacterium]
MEVTFSVDEAKIDSFLTEVMENYPEASSPSLRCIPHDDGKWGYVECEYFFDEVEEDSLCPDPKCGTIYSKRIGRAVYLLKRDDLRRGFELFMRKKLAGELKGIDLDVSPLFDRDADWGDWACDWDADALDCLVQCAIYGDVIYG